MMVNERPTVSRASRRHEGQTLAEYSVVLGVITVAIVAAFSLLSAQIESAFSFIADLI
jgi:Flp pilus assembly pilin Flp